MRSRSLSEIDSSRAVRTEHRSPTNARLHLLWPVYLHAVLLTSHPPTDGNVLARAASHLRALGLTTPEQVADALRIPVPLARRLTDLEIPRAPRQRFVDEQAVPMYAMRDALTGESIRRMLPASTPVLPMERTEKPEVRRLARVPGEPPIEMRVVRAPLESVLPMGIAEARDCWVDFRRDYPAVRSLAPDDAPLRVLDQRAQLRLLPLAIVQESLSNPWSVWDSVTGHTSLRWRLRIERAELKWLDAAIERATRQYSGASELAQEEARRRGIDLGALPDAIADQAEQVLLQLVKLLVGDGPNGDEDPIDRATSATVEVLGAILIRSLVEWPVPRPAIAEIESRLPANLLLERLPLVADSLPSVFRDSTDNLARELQKRPPRGLRLRIGAVALSAAFNANHPLRKVLAERPDALVVWDQLADMHDAEGSWDDSDMTRDEATELCLESLTLAVQLLSRRRTGGHDSDE